MRDWLFLLRLHAGGTFYQVGYTEDILAELIARFRDANPRRSGGDITRLHDKLVANFDFRIDDWTDDPDYVGADEGDRHVHSAAQSGSVDALLTDDAGFRRMRDALGEEGADALDYVIMTPDDFFILIDDSQPRIALDVVREQLDYYRGRDETPELVERLERAGCPRFAARVRGHLMTLSGVSSIEIRRELQHADRDGTLNHSMDASAR